MTTAYHRLAYMVPVPLKTSSFMALEAKDQIYNVETDLGAIQAFGTQGFQAKSGSSLLYSDLQLNADANAPLRLGSGRSGFYRRVYLKGIGRTSLAANWTDKGDAYHMSGHLLASAALKEWIVSRYLEAKGVEAKASINGCSGLLLKPLDPKLKDFALKRTQHKALAPIDRSLQAITVKAGNFTRFANIVWLLMHHQPQASFVGELLETLSTALLAPGSQAVSAQDAQGLVKALLERMTITIRRFLNYSQWGVYWGSFHNNFTIDGRFLDLEVPLIIGGPFFGMVAEDPFALAANSKPYPSLCVGLEVFHYIRQMRCLLRFLVARLAFLKDFGMFYPGIEQNFLKDLIFELKRVFNSRSLLFSGQRLKAMLHRHYTQVLDLSPKEQGHMAALIEAQYEGYFHGHWRLERGLKWQRVAKLLAPPEPGTKPLLFVPHFLGERFAKQEKLAFELNSLMLRLSDEKTIRSVFEALKSPQLKQSLNL